MIILFFIREESFIAFIKKKEVKSGNLDSEHRLFLFRKKKIRNQWPLNSTKWNLSLFLVVKFQHQKKCQWLESASCSFHICKNKFYDTQRHTVSWSQTPNYKLLDTQSNVLRDLTWFLHINAFWKKKFLFFFLKILSVAKNLWLETKIVPENCIWDAKCL